MGYRPAHDRNLTVGYKKKKVECEAVHPRRNVKCWGSHLPDEAHWATLLTKDGLQKVTWVD